MIVFQEALKKTRQAQQMELSILRPFPSHF